MKQLRIALTIALLLISLVARSATGDSCSRKVPQRLVSVAGTVAINAAVTEALKSAIHERRPDGSSNNSFPSRHTSWAFAASTAISNELYRYSPWWSVGAHTLASAVGFQRVASNRHYASDVLAGAATGILSAELSYFICSRIWKNECRTALPYNDFRMNFAISTDGWFGVSPGSAECVYYGMSASFRAPLSDYFGLGGRLSATSQPLRGIGRSIEGGSLTVGGTSHYTISGSWSFEGALEAGFELRRHTSGTGMSEVGFQCLAEPAISLRLTRNFAVRAAIPVKLHTIPAAKVAFGTSIASVVIF